MDLSPSTAGLYVDQLINDGLIVEAGCEQGAKGRPKRNLRVKAEAGWFAGLEFNATRVQAVAIDFAGTIIKSSVFSFRQPPLRKDIRRAMEAALNEMRKEIAIPLLSIGVGAAGVVVPQEGISKYYAFVDDWENVPVVAELQQKYQVPVKLENNLRAIALAERWFGDAKLLDDYVILGPRSGFGVAIVKDGRLISGSNHAAGEIGLWDWPIRGHKGLLHHHLAAPAVLKRLTDAKPNDEQYQDIYEAYRDIQFMAPRHLEWPGVIEDFARVIGYLHLLLDSGRYFLHGPLTAFGEQFCNAIAERSTTLMTALKDRPPRVVPSTMTDEAGALGAASLAMEAWEPALPK
jgi:predicted NBD/HSP70 family sugar kinase